MEPFGENSEIVKDLLDRREERGESFVVNSDISIAILSIIAGMGYSESRIDETIHRLRYTEANDVTDDEALQRALINAGFNRGQSLRIVTNALRVTGHVSKEPSEIERILNMEDGEEKERLLREAGMTVITDSDNISDSF